MLVRGREGPANGMLLRQATWQFLGSRLADGKPDHELAQGSLLPRVTRPCVFCCVCIRPSWAPVPPNRPSPGGEDTFQIAPLITLRISSPISLACSGHPPRQVSTYTANLAAALTTAVQTSGYQSIADLRGTAVAAHGIYVQRLSNNEFLTAQAINWTGQATFVQVNRSTHTGHPGVWSLLSRREAVCTEGGSLSADGPFASRHRHPLDWSGRMTLVRVGHLTESLLCRGHSVLW